MSLQKRIPYRNKKLLKASNGRSCVRCHIDDGTIVRAHYTGFRQHTFGKGTSQKCDDHASADLCIECHTYFDQETQHKSIEKSEEFLTLILLTLKRDFEEGVIR